MLFDNVSGDTSILVGPYQSINYAIVLTLSHSIRC